ncbi:MAG: 3-deoxy-manno-octulosonate cytidylyltransferase [Kiritimatiellae bacterium]|nr:3-deoxy-manno-octulosonate cytidylyltransferase [Kiritimatiellia bacterium]
MVLKETPIKKKSIGVIPTRWASTRFPGKILTPLCKKPLIQWVVERVQQATFLDQLLVATDDERIKTVVEDLGVDVVLTRSDHPSGTDRIAEAISEYDAEIVVNIQGDEPLINPNLIDQVAAVISENHSWDMATATAPIDREQDLHDPSVVKVVCDQDLRVLYFSRAPIPFSREKELSLSVSSMYWRHIGIYGYKRSFLEKLVKIPPCTTEKIEKLEQLRALHIGAHIRMIKTEEVSLGVDTPEDVQRVEAILRIENGF